MVGDRVALADALLDLEYPVGGRRWVTMRALLKGEPGALGAVAAAAEKQAGMLRKQAPGWTAQKVLLEQAAALKGRALSALTVENRETLQRAAKLLLEVQELRKR